MLSYLQPKDGPVVAGEEQHERVFAKDQPEYIPLRTLVQRDAQGGVLSRWAPTEEQRKAIAEGADIYLELLTFHTPLQPILMFVAGDGDSEEIKAAFWPVREPR
jgi:hypothetical protein